ncbi:uncharacterized protein LOC134311830 [Trichomycterus rosablanca]|uniref:uncharacterized protein LOC134311830 n=1 Tax=Trichomycterus rosablanca TaxID=2290929 RepID=UPI002F3512D5
MFTFIFMCMWISLGDSTTDPIKPLDPHKSVTEGDTVTLSCSYKDFSGNVNNLQWYRQYPKSKPEFLLSTVPFGDPSKNISLRLSAKGNQDMKQVDLNISSAAVSDSAIYYCALVPTVTGNPAALYKNFNTDVLADPLLNSMFIFFYTSAQTITSVSTTENVLEGNSVTLSCNYSGSGGDELLWYRQYSTFRPEFIILVADYQKEAPGIRMPVVAGEFTPGSRRSRHYRA